MCDPEARRLELMVISLYLLVWINYIINAVILFISSSYFERYKPKTLGVLLIVTGSIYSTLFFFNQLWLSLTKEVDCLYVLDCEVRSGRMWSATWFMAGVVSHLLTIPASLFLILLGIAVLLKGEIKFFFNIIHVKKRNVKLSAFAFLPLLIINVNMMLTAYMERNVNSTYIFFIVLVFFLPLVLILFISSLWLFKIMFVCYQGNCGKLFFYIIIGIEVINLIPYAYLSINQGNIFFIIYIISPISISYILIKLIDKFVIRGITYSVHPSAIGKPAGLG